MQQPQQQTKFFGHQNIESDVVSSFANNNLHHSLLVTGNKGVGKATFVHRLARYLLAGKTSDNMDVAFDAPNVQRMINDSHGDLLVVSPDEGASEIKVEQIRKVSEFLSLTASEAEYRVVIIDSADDLNINAANALLKTLEEPNKGSYVILVSHNPSRLLKTIASRCRRIHLNNLDHDNMGELLEYLDINIDENNIAYKLANGSVGQLTRYIEAGIDEIFEKLHLHILSLPKIDMEDFYNNFVEKYFAGKDNKALFAMFLDAYEIWLAQLIRSIVETSEFYDNQVRDVISKNMEMDKLLDYWHEFLNIRNDAVNLNMDAVQTVTQLITRLK